MLSTVRISSNGAMKCRQRLYGTWPMASAPTTTTEVGVIRFTMPDAD